MCGTKTDEMQRQAHQAAMWSRDFLSLLMTKTNPSQAQTTLSQGIREAIPIGTLGMDKINARDTRLTIARRDDNKVVGKGWKIQALDRSVDSILAAATRLETEIDRETKYWEEILAVDEKGWKTCKLPQERHTLGVRFGFFEAPPSFRNRSLAALQRRDDGSVYLDQGVSDPTPKRVLVRIETDGIVTGTLKPERAVPDDAPLESLILRARNTILEEELWQELNREARTLANHDVRWDGTGLSVKLSPTTKVLLTLEILDESLPEYEGSHEDDAMAEAISISMHLLLLYGHRQALHRRRQAPIPVSAAPQPPMRATNILRPMLKRITYENVLTDLSSTLTSLHNVLNSAGLSVPKFTLTSKSRDPSKSKKPSAEAAIESLIEDLQAEFTIPLTTSPEQSLVVMMRIENSLQTRWRIKVNAPADIPGGLLDVARPLPRDREYGDLKGVRGYILWAAECALAVGFANNKKPDLGIPPAMQADAMDVDGAAKANSVWHLAAVPALVRRDVPAEKEATQARDVHQVTDVSFVFKENAKSEERVELHVLFKRRAACGKETKEMVFRGEADGEASPKLPYIMNNLAAWDGEGARPEGFETWERKWMPLRK